MKKLEDLWIWLIHSFHHYKIHYLNILSSEGKDEGFYEARFKNAIEGALLGSVVEGTS